MTGNDCKRLPSQWTGGVVTVCRAGAAEEIEEEKRAPPCELGYPRTWCCEARSRAKEAGHSSTQAAARSLGLVHGCHQGLVLAGAAGALGVACLGRALGGRAHSRFSLRRALAQSSVQQPDQLREQVAMGAIGQGRPWHPCREDPDAAAREARGEEHVQERAQGPEHLPREQQATARSAPPALAP
eukprot:CAMPEP_0185207720 /NCGR_PEP_ID=MMETSP1140-20130426/60757_1 /TAXON_ID=298111 /ORGANISM="Pavlova sp., Strain CCMP459" /LENGTH=184 /DNA_ID=CAMNT_0027775415 /DNA_START=135 /DNA_END=685 /DNA_ORIENTATION=-